MSFVPFGKYRGRQALTVGAAAVELIVAPCTWRVGHMLLRERLEVPARLLRVVASRQRVEYLHVVLRLPRTLMSVEHRHRVLGAIWDSGLFPDLEQASDRLLLHLDHLLEVLESCLKIGFVVLVLLNHGFLPVGDRRYHVFLLLLQLAFELVDSLVDEQSVILEAHVVGD